MEEKLDKIYDLMEKMYIEFSKKFENQDMKIDSIYQNQVKMDMKIEQNIEPKLQALYEAKDIIYDRLDKIEDKVDTVASRMEKQEVEIKVMRGGK